MSKFSLKSKGRYFFATIHIANFINAGLSKEQYTDYEYVSNFFVDRWRQSKDGRDAACVVCLSHNNGIDCYHMHMVCWCSNPTTGNTVRRLLFKSHVEPVMGGRPEIKDYILKQGKYADKDEEVLYSLNVEGIPEIKKGHRSDLDEVASMLEDGLTPSQIYDFDFKLRRFEKMINAAYMNRRYKETPIIKEMHNEYHFGASGTGKTYTYVKACEEFGEENVFLINDYQNGGFDTYTAQDIVIMDEYRANLQYSYLLSLLDKYSRYQVHCRFANKHLLWTRTILISIYPIEEIYKLMVPEEQRTLESKIQLIRRFDEIVYHYINDSGEYCEFRMPADKYVDAQDMISRVKTSEQSEEMKSALKDFGATPINNDKQ